MKTIAEQSTKLAQKKARLQRQEVALEEKQRRARVRLLFQCGELAEKTGLLKLGAEALYGAFLSIERDAADEKAIARWTEAGRKALAAEAVKAEQSWAPVVIAFEGPVEREIGRELRASGFRYNTVMKQWEARVDPELAATLARKHNGILRKFVLTQYVDVPLDKAAE